MIFWILCIALVLGTAFMFTIGKRCDDDLLSCITIVTGILTAIVLVSTACIIIEHTGNDGYIAKLQTRYDSLLYQAENHLFDDDINVSKKQLADQITEWNEDLASNKNLQRDPWVGIFKANIYDEFKFIPIELLGGNQ